MVIRLRRVNQVEAAFRIIAVGYDADGVAIRVDAILHRFINHSLPRKTRGIPEIVIGVGIGKKTVFLTDTIIVDHRRANFEGEIVPVKGLDSSRLAYRQYKRNGHNTIIDDMQPHGPQNIVIDNEIGSQKAESELFNHSK